MKLQTLATSDKMEVLYPGNLALLSMFLKNPESEGLGSVDAKKKGLGNECPDVLTCGVCQKDFLLADILRFIQHKVHCQQSRNRRTETQDLSLHPEGTNGDLGAESPPPASSSPMEDEGEAPENQKGEEKRKREEEDEATTKKRPRSMQDAEANTTDSEPAKYVCGTCGSVLSSAWSLVQHVQLSHGIIIYQESSGGTPTTSPSTPPGVPKPSHSSPQASVSSTAPAAPPGPSTPLPIPLLDPSKVDLSKVDLSKVDLSKIVSPVSSGTTPLPPHPPVTAPLLDPTHPLNLLRMPLGDGRSPFPPGFTPPFVRPGHDFRMEQLLQEGLRLNPSILPPHFERPPFLDPGLGAPRPQAPTPISSGGDPNFDFYSQRLRQLAGTTSPTSSTSPRKPLPTPPFSSPNIPASSTPAPAQTPTSTRSDCASQEDKQFKCDSCSRRFRWESNLAIHQRVHTGEKDFRCLRCEETFSTIKGIRIHMRAHRKSPRHESNSPDSSRPQVDGGQEDDDDIELEEEEEEDEEADEANENELEEEEEEEDLNVSGTDSNEEEDEETNVDGNDDEDTPEDLSTSKFLPASSVSQSVTSSTVLDNKEKNIKSEQQKSVVGELMDKFGFSNISTYSEAYQQALKESGRLLPQHLLSRDGKPFSPNGIDKTIRIRQDLSKGLIPGQPSLDIAHQTLLGAFDNPYDAQKRLASATRDGTSLYTGLWLPTLTAASGAHRDLFPTLPPSEANFLHKKLLSDGSLKSSEAHGTIPKPGTSSAPGTPLSLVPAVKKESRRNDTCEYCGKIFKNCSNLTVHRRSHTGEKPYKCDLCSYACAQSSKLTRHMKTHGRIGKDVYRCRFCDMPFSVASTLEKHMRKCVVNQNSKGLFPPISAGGHEAIESYKLSTHFTSVMTEDSKPITPLFPSPFPTTVTTNSNDDTGDSSSLSGPGS